MAKQAALGGFVCSGSSLTVTYQMCDQPSRYFFLIGCAVIVISLWVSPYLLSRVCTEWQGALEADVEVLDGNKWAIVFDKVSLNEACRVVHTMRGMNKHHT